MGDAKDFLKGHDDAIAASVKTALKTDGGQLKQGGFTEFAAKEKTKTLAKRKK